MRTLIFVLCGGARIYGRSTLDIVAGQKALILHILIEIGVKADAKLTIIVKKGFNRQNSSQNALILVILCLHFLVINIRSLLFLIFHFEFMSLSGTLLNFNFEVWNFYL